MKNIKNIAIGVLIIFIFGVSFGFQAQTKSKSSGKKVRKQIAKVDKEGKKKLIAEASKNETKKEPVQIAETVEIGDETNVTLVRQLPVENKESARKTTLFKEFKIPSKESDLTKNYKVMANANENPVFVVKMAQRAVVLVDFPANDPVYKIHPGAEEFVTVTCDNRTANGYCGNTETDAIVLRPGEKYHTLGSEESVATIITIQRRSGLVATLIIVPAKTIAENTNYISVEYSPEDVVAYRQSVGLPFNLSPFTKGVKTDGQEEKKRNLAKSEKSGDGQIVEAKLENEKTATDNKAASEEPSLEKYLIETLRSNIQTNNSLKFNKPVYGLSLARIPFYESRVKDITVEIVAVRNTLNIPVRLMPQQPQLVIADRNEKKQLINIKNLDILHTVTTVEEDEVLLPGKIYYFVFAYESPVMGVRQELRISVARREAEDAPVTISLDVNNKR